MRMGDNNILYQGAVISIATPLVKVGRPELDFAPGFYVTHDKQQATAWAQTKASRRKDGQPILNVYRFAEDAFLSETSWKRLVFPEYSLEWLNFVAASRKGQQSWENYDWIEGGIANDSVISTVDAYVDGFITAEQAIGQLVNAELKHQICVRHQNIVNRFLTFIESVELER